MPIEVSKLDELEQFGITKIVAAIGVFDGIHLGHREIIKELIKMSDEQSAAPVVITFFPHPRRVLYPDKPLRFLRTPAKKAKILGDLGIKAIVTVPFTLEFCSYLLITPAGPTTITITEGSKGFRLINSPSVSLIISQKASPPML